MCTVCGELDDLDAIAHRNWRRLSPLLTVQHPYVLLRFLTDFR